MMKLTPSEVAESDTLAERIEMALACQPDPFLTELLKVRERRPAFFLAVVRLITLDVHHKLRHGLDSLSRALRDHVPAAHPEDMLH